MTHNRGIVLKELAFTGPSVSSAGVEFDAGLTVIFGASNTGKSFAFKSIDFLLGASRPLPEIDERVGFTRAWLSLTLPTIGDTTFARSMAGGPVERFEGHAIDHDAVSALILSGKHNPESPDNVSQFLLSEIGLGSHIVMTNATGSKRTLSFRDLSRFCLVDETTIQSEKTPAETGERGATIVDRSVFKLLVTGEDDRAVVSGVPSAIFKASKAAKIEQLQEMLDALAKQVANVPPVEQLQNQTAHFEDLLREVQSEAQRVREAVLQQLTLKEQLMKEAARLRSRRSDVAVNLSRFRHLTGVYESDLKRLESLEEAGFLLLLGSDQDCPLCGAAPEAQRQSHHLADIKDIKDASIAEMATIQQQKTHLTHTIKQLEGEAKVLEGLVEEITKQLESAEVEINRSTPEAERIQARVLEVIGRRDEVRSSLELYARIGELETRRNELVQLKTSKADRPKVGVASTVTHDFAQVVSQVLTEWKFPGQRHVSFDDKTFDLKIDGKHRKDNGKGVRAITHAAFKVAAFLFCHERGLPHPGFVVLDTPLLTYRDPLRSKAGALSSDETALKSTDLKEHFFRHLSELGKLGQFIVMENVDLPAGIESYAKVETFVGEAESVEAWVGRVGLFPPMSKKPELVPA